jgi:hypothetical protein
MNDRNTGDTQKRKINLVMWIFLGFIAYFLITEHWAHIVPFLPWLILLACPLLHVFMHGGHGHGTHDGHSHHKED